MNFKETQQKRTEEINRILSEYLPKEEGMQAKIMEAMQYSVTAGGKRLRPMIMWEVYRMFGGMQETEVAPFMAAMEMIHTYSLVHDDLPAMDNDKYRRGKLTTHAKYGEAMGVLTGDALLNYAFEVMAAAVAEAKETQIRNAAKAFRILAEKAGIYGMIGGQVVDTEPHGETTIELLNYINKRKTAALLEACMMAGAVLAGAETESVEKLEIIAEKIGLAFQIQDDILDVTANEELLGKPLHSDEKNGKQTYVALAGLEEAREAVARLSNDAVALFDTLPYENAFLRELLLSLITREH